MRRAPLRPPPPLPPHAKSGPASPWKAAPPRFRPPLTGPVFCCPPRGPEPRSRLRPALRRARRPRREGRRGAGPARRAGACALAPRTPRRAGAALPPLCPHTQKTGPPPHGRRPRPASGPRSRGRFFAARREALNLARTSALTARPALHPPRCPPRAPARSPADTPPPSGSSPAKNRCCISAGKTRPSTRHTPARRTARRTSPAAPARPCGGRRFRTRCPPC